MHKQLKKIFIRESPAEIDWVLCSICLLMDKIAETIEDVYRQFIVHYAKYSKYTKLMDHQDYREIMQELQQNLGLMKTVGMWFTIILSRDSWTITGRQERRIESGLKWTVRS